MTISSTRKIAAARPIKPTLVVFSGKCGVSEMTDAGIAMTSLFLSNSNFSLLAHVCSFAPTFSLKDETRYKIACGNMNPTTQESPLDDIKEIRRIDKSSMLLFSLEASCLYGEPARTAEE